MVQLAIVACHSGCNAVSSTRVADAGGDFSATLYHSFSLSAQAVVGDARYRWVLEDGDYAPIVHSGERVATFTPRTVGEYVFRLVVEIEGRSYTDEVAVLAPPAADEVAVLSPPAIEGLSVLLKSFFTPNMRFSGETK